MELSAGLTTTDVVELARERSDSSYRSSAAAASETEAGLCLHLEDKDENRVLMEEIPRKCLFSDRLPLVRLGTSIASSERS